VAFKVEVGLGVAVPVGVIAGIGEGVLVSSAMGCAVGAGDVDGTQPAISTAPKIIVTIPVINFRYIDPSFL